MNPPARRRWRRVDGVLLLDKPSGITSNDALQKARRLFSAEKAGHTGTLDPMASGLLPVCFGEATKFSADLLDADKTYEATLRLGVTTTTADAEGEVLETRPVQVGEADLRAVLPRFTGAIEQVPPMYSALKRDGKPLYELARQGIEVERAARAVVIHELTLLACAGTDVSLRVRCSKGTYIRTLAEDIGSALGCGAHLTALRRTRVGSLELAGARTLAEIEACAEEGREALLRPVDTLLSGLPPVVLDEAQTLRFGNGNPVAADVVGPCRVYAGGRLLGLGLGDGAGRLHPKRLIAR
ncbi:tRNA pseudouridine(55) synthase TruB [Azospira restricta]|uniref:tRNA pseudouridine synthase B n=1 Tax=Azospira restricta TaxID=404405 RepID=A0A974SND5_9RHOO|nr:tRNA pseudouridine(55) synthase TruB [Azospira restricta]QRJ62693.1 tRNA pseudouridine(55) synthase TruB [Azospira restricta]